MKKNLFVISVLLIFALGFTGCSKKNSGETVKKDGATTVRLAIQPSAAFIPMYVAREKGWIEEALKESQIKVVWQDFTAGPPINESLASGNSDIGLSGDVPSVSSIAAGQKNEFIGVPANGPDAYAVLISAKNSSIKSASDLRGKKVATVIGSTGHNLIKKVVEKEGFTLNDIELVNISAGDAGVVLSTGNADAVVIWEPNVTRLVDNGTAKVLVSGSYTNLRGTNTFLARKEFTTANPKITAVVLEQFARAVAELDKLDDATLNAVSEKLSLEPAQVKKLIGKYNFAVTVDDVDAAALQDTINFLVSIDVLNKAYSAKDYVNTSYFEASGAKKYLKNKK